MKPRIVLSFLLLLSFVAGGPVLADETPTVSDSVTDGAAVEQTAEPATETAGNDRATAIAPFGTPVFVDAPGACLGSAAPAPLGAAGLMGCPYGPTCYSDAQCAFVCGALGTGVCGPNFCCWCIAG
ncbi:MAG: hypothetical protein AAGE94_09850 [Acidobacteriota bacterium]